MPLYDYQLFINEDDIQHILILMKVNWHFRILNHQVGGTVSGAGPLWALWPWLPVELWSNFRGSGTPIKGEAMLGTGVLCFHVGSWRAVRRWVGLHPLVVPFLFLFPNKRFSFGGLPGELFGQSTLLAPNVGPREDGTSTASDWWAKLWRQTELFWLDFHSLSLKPQMGSSPGSEPTGFVSGVLQVLFRNCFNFFLSLLFVAVCMC